MVIGTNIVPFITDFVSKLDNAIAQDGSHKKLSAIQKYWLAFCLMGILATQSVCWAKFERASFGRYNSAALSWVFYHATIPWEKLLQCSVRLILNSYGLTKGSLVIDDSDNKRSKNTKKIWSVHKLKDKASGGYIMGQGLVFMVVVHVLVSFFRNIKIQHHISFLYFGNSKVTPTRTPKPSGLLSTFSTQ